MTAASVVKPPKTAERAGRGVLEERKDAAILGAIEQYRTRPERPDVTFNEDGRLSSSVDEHLQHCDVLGTSLYAFAGMQVCRLAEVVIQPGQTTHSDPTDASNRTAAALAIVAAVEPTNELEAALGVQMAGSHELVMDMLRRARRSERVDHMALYGGLAVKLQRTFAAQVEALAKLRTAGKQIVEVNHVHTYVGEGGQAIVGDVHYAKTHELKGPAAAPSPPLLGQDAGRGALPGAGCVRAPKVPHARRDRRGSTKG